MPVPANILELVERFEQNLPAYKQGRYNETQVRHEFIDPLFEALGWDINNKQGYSETFKEVIHEDAIKVGGATKAPDYAFRIGSVRQFFLEAKKPSVNIKDDVHPAYQLRRYAWSAKLPLSILTDFEEFAVYDCRVKPANTDNAATARILYLNFRDYPARWDELAGIFGKEAILKGGYERFADDHKSKRGTSEVDHAFLAEIEAWRDALARNIALRNPTLNQRNLNFCVQLTIDRIIFLRIAEDRGLEPYGRLRDLAKLPDIYRQMVMLFQQADDRYNSGLFHFKTEKGRPDDSRDTLTPNLLIDDKVLKDILKHLYYPDSPYEFSVLPADILGQVYEQFLGKVIRLTDGHRAVVEEKPEVKKAGGVYYTPTYIVDYIVRQTVGKLVEGKTPGHISNLKILDPACGSGSFLLGAYQYLLDWHLNYYTQNEPEKQLKKRNAPIAPLPTGTGYRLTLAERKRILLNTIHGVDIDSQAVEVTKLSLLLKVLEGETEQQLSFLQERVLPDLEANIKCGNSLIGPDFYQAKQLGFLDEEELYRINAFDWQTEFKEIMQAGGFDAVIGNPPYIRIQAMKEWAPLEVEFYKKQYVSASKGNYDIYVIFVEKGLNLLNANGKLGFILPNKFFATDYGQELRQILSNKKALSRIVDFGHAQVFTNATTYTCLLFLSQSPNISFQYKMIETPVSIIGQELIFKEMNATTLTASQWIFISGRPQQLFDKLGINSQPLLKLPCLMSRGSSSGNDEVFILERSNDPNVFLTSRGNKVTIEQDILRIPIFATDYSRYLSRPNSNKVIIFPYLIHKDRFELIAEETLKTNFPKTYKYLYDNRKILEQRKQYKKWYAFSAPRNLFVHDVAHLIVPLLADRGLYTELPIHKEHYCLMASGGFSISVDESCNLSPKYILGLLNSKVLFGYLENISNRFRGGWITCTKQYVGKLPIRTIDFNNPTEVAQHSQMVQLVEQMLELNRQLATAAAPHTKTILQRQIAATDREIDQLVYQLYNLTPEEITLVENSVK